MHIVQAFFCMAASIRRVHKLCMNASMHRILVGQRLRIAIEALGLTQIEVAAAIGTSPSGLGNWLRGDSYPPPIAMVKLHRRYNITPGWLLVGELSGLPSGLAADLWKSVQASPEVSPELALQARET